jgi:hypothetical protein
MGVPGRAARVWAGVMLGAAGLVACVGTLWAFQRGGSDFNVFYEAWRAVLRGQGADIYRITPDRFLYAPGFAWLFAPIGLLPRDLALALWCVAKSAGLGWLAAAVAARLPLPRAGALAAAGAGLLVWARPLLIDYQYGQVNAFLMVAGMAALLTHGDPAAGRARRGLTWLGLGALAAAKLLLLPMLAVPLLRARASGRARLELAAAVAGVALIVALPALTEGPAGAIALLGKWLTALAGRGFPLESHNQSFAAFLYHWFSGEPTHVIAWGASRAYGWALLDAQARLSLAAAWACASLAALTAWLLLARRDADPVRWAALGLGLLILPSHLVWKPYFVFGIPAAAWLAARAASARGLIALGAAFVLVNLTSYDFVGHEWAGRVESAAALLFTHVGLLVWLAINSRRPAARATGPTPSPPPARSVEVAGPGPAGPRSPSRPAARPGSGRRAR